jgi:hypothetical protein
VVLIGRRPWRGLGVGEKSSEMRKGEITKCRIVRDFPHQVTILSRLIGSLSAWNAPAAAGTDIYGSPRFVVGMALEAYALPIILPLLAAVMVGFAMRLIGSKASPAFWMGVGCALMVTAVVLTYETPTVLDLPTGMILIGFLISAFAHRAVRPVTSWNAILDFANGFWPVTAVEIYWFL